MAANGFGKQQFTEAAKSALRAMIGEGLTNFSDTDVAVYSMGAEDADNPIAQLLVQAWRDLAVVNSAIKDLTKEGFTIVRLSGDAFTSAGGLKRAPRTIVEAKERIGRSARPTRGIHVVTGNKDDDLYWLAYSTLELGGVEGLNAKTLNPIARIVEGGTLTPESALEMTGPTARVIEEARGRINAIEQRSTVEAEPVDEEEN